MTKHADPLQLAAEAAEASGDPDRIYDAYERLGYHRAARARNRMFIDPQADGVEVLVGGRQSGKTHAVVEWVKAGRAQSTPRTIVVRDNAYRDRMRRDFDLTHEEIVSWRSLRDDRDPAAREYAVDEADEVLAGLLGIRNLTLVSICEKDHA